MTPTDPQLPPPVSKTAPDTQHPTTFTFRAAEEPENVTVALRGLADCVICGHDILAGSFVVIHGPDRWAHESCAHPGRPPRKPLNAREGHGDA